MRASKPVPRKTRQELEKKKERVYVYFETKSQVGYVLRAAKKAQNKLRPNLSQYIYEAAMHRAAQDIAEIPRLTEHAE